MTVPNVLPGEYLLRPEIVALHEADAKYVVLPSAHPLTQLSQGTT